MSEAPNFASDADRRGHEWLVRWAALGNELTNDEDGNLKITHRRDPESVAMAGQLRADPLLTHAVGRAFLNYLKLGYANCPDEPS